jgi:tetratricopeptide (TPR) repeat protein
MNKPQAALGHFQAFHRQRPDDREVLLPLADCLFRLGRTAEAKQTVAEALSGDGDFAEEYLKAGQLLLSQGLFADALKPLSRSLEREPGSDECRLALALAESRLNHPARVVELLADHPMTASSLYTSLLASALCDLKHFQEAVYLLEGSIHRYPDEETLYFQMALAYAELSKHREAAEVLQQASARWPDDAHIRSRLANEKMLAGTPDEAAEILSKGGGAPLSAGDLDLLTRSYLALKRFDEARRYGEMAEARDDVPASSLIALANVYQLQDRDPDVIALLERHRSRFSNSPAYLYTLALSYYNRGNYSISKQLVEQVLSLDPHLAQALYLRGSCLASLGKPEEAIASYEAAAHLVPNSYLYQLYLGLMLSKLGDKQQAEEHLKRAVELDGSHAPARYELAKIYSESSRYELALQELEEAIKSEPRFESSYYLLSRLYARLGRPNEAKSMMKELEAIQRQGHEGDRALKQRAMEQIDPTSQKQ